MIKDVRHYDAIVSPVITEKATIASESNQFVFKVAATRPSRRSRRRSRNCSTSRSRRSIRCLRKGKNKAFRGVRGRQQDMKKAVVTLADGHRIDMTTGL